MALVLNFCAALRGAPRSAEGRPWASATKEGSMPQSSETIQADPYLRALIMGAPKVGKSSSIISTSPAPYVINCDLIDSALAGAKRFSKRSFDFDPCKGWSDMETCWKYAKDGVKEGKYKTIIVDTLSSWAGRVEEECLAGTMNDKGQPDGRRAYPEYNRRLRHAIERFFKLPAHFVAVCHYLETGGGIEEGLPKTGEGLVPLLAGKARAEIPMLFSDVIFMDYRKGERIFVTGPQGAWGPGSRSLDGSQVLSADISKLLSAIKEANKSARANHAPPPRERAR
jgi:hypothetical protein